MPVTNNIAAADERTRAMISSKLNTCLSSSWSQNTNKVKMPVEISVPFISIAAESKSAQGGKYACSSHDGGLWIYLYPQLDFTQRSACAGFREPGDAAGWRIRLCRSGASGREAACAKTACKIEGFQGKERKIRSFRGGRSRIRGALHSNGWCGLQRCHSVQRSPRVAIRREWYGSPVMPGRASRP